LVEGRAPRALMVRQVHPERELTLRQAQGERVVEGLTMSSLLPGVGCAPTVSGPAEVGHDISSEEMTNMHRPPAAMIALAWVAPAQPARADTIEGRWKLLKAEGLRADGSVGRLPWGAHPVGAIVVERGACYVQIMSSDVPSFDAAKPPADQM